ncbi:MAG: gliding motility-associated C-terminal domain-containing protein [Chitinophagaceae bacterium]|nr:gliding motility-associated C-terminal domain-containing protein [Chitinophagaceae bacterium]
MRKILLLIICLSGLTVSGQNIGGIINDYTAVTSMNQNVFDVTTTTNFNVGDKVMVIKMKGASINQTNSPSYGDTINTNQAGLYIFSKVIAKTATNLTLSPYCSLFTNSDYLQIVRIPQYSNATVIATITCPAYDGSIGGIIAFEADTLNLQANIDASEKGYRGGDLWGNSFFCGGTGTYYSAQIPFGPEGKKGEAIADWIPTQECGCAKLANGGGGAFAGNCGAGGGANFGRGGNGGWEYSGCLSTNVFGYGGQALNHDTSRFYMGGGGGAPQSDNGFQIYNAGSGGGIIYIKSNQVNGNGFVIQSNGGTTPIINDEGAAGGGAGGSIYLNVLNYTGNINVRANGGAGGSNNNVLFVADCHGPGGGGGGGLIHLSSASLPAGMTTSALGGAAGLVLNPNSTCFNTSYHAEPGNDGNLKFNFLPSVLPNTTGINLGPDVPVCLGLAVTLDPGPGHLSYLWDDLSTGQTRSTTTAGTFYVTVVNSVGCTASDTIIVTLDTSIHANFNIIPRLGCENDTIQLVNTSTGAGNYLWWFGDSQSSLLDNPTHVYQNQMVYFVTLIAFNGLCSDTLVQAVNVTHPLIADNYIYSNSGSIMVDSTCVYNNLNAQSLSVPVGLTSHLFYWGDGTFTDVGFNTLASHKYTEGGNFIVTMVATDTLGCHDTISKPVYVDPASFGDFTISDSIVCVGSPILFYDTISSFTQSFSYDFGDQTTMDDIENPTHTYDRDGNYIVTLTVRNTICPDTSVSRNIIVDDFPVMDLGPDTSICAGITGTIILSNLQNQAGVYEWSTGDVANNLSVTEPGIYWIKGVSPNAGCITIDTIEVKRDCYLNIPNAFSPDGDGMNDYFMPRNLLSSGVTFFRLTIYNRWGELIYSTTATDGRGWDGKFNGKLQPMGTYVYLVDVIFDNFVKKNYQGNVTLIR